MVHYGVNLASGLKILLWRVLFLTDISSWLGCCECVRLSTLPFSMRYSTHLGSTAKTRLYNQGQGWDDCYENDHLGCDWTNPFEKYQWKIGSFPQGSKWMFKKKWYHQLVIGLLLPGIDYPKTPTFGAWHSRPSPAVHHEPRSLPPGVDLQVEALKTSHATNRMAEELQKSGLKSCWNAKRHTTKMVPSASICHTLKLTSLLNPGGFQNQLQKSGSTSRCDILQLLHQSNAIGGTLLIFAEVPIDVGKYNLQQNTSSTAEANTLAGKIHDYCAGMQAASPAMNGQS